VFARQEERQKVPAGVPPPTKVYLLMESRLSREALTRILRRCTDVTVVGEGEQPEQARSAMVTSMCDVLVMDTSDLECLSGDLWPDACLLPEFKILLIGMNSDADQFLAAVRSGVTGYLLKDAPASEIVVAIRALARGEAHCPPQLCLTLFQYVSRRNQDAQRESITTIPDLTLRQQKLVNLVAEGLTNKEIACQLNLSAFTVRNHMHRIMQHLKVANRREVVATVLFLQRQSCQVSARAGSHSNHLDAETQLRNAHLQRVPRAFGFVRHSTIQPMQFAEGSRSQAQTYKGESQ
jgi:two-component system, NarL family, response regulator NreC